MTHETKSAVKSPMARKYYFTDTRTLCKVQPTY